MNEIWKTIEEFPEYEVSNCGNVRSKDREFYDSLNRHYFKKGQLLKLEQQICSYGYIQIMVGITSNKKMHRLIVARLVTKTFIPNPNNLPQVNHKDEDSTNNHVDNLEWCDCKYNINYKDLIKRRSEHKCRSVDVFDRNMNYIETLPSAIAASEKYNISRGSISSCCNNKITSVKNYCFKFH